MGKNPLTLFSKKELENPFPSPLELFSIPFDFITNFHLNLSQILEIK